MTSPPLLLDPPFRILIVCRSSDVWSLIALVDQPILSSPETRFQFSARTLLLPSPTRGGFLTCGGLLPKTGSNPRPERILSPLRLYWYLVLEQFKHTLVELFHKLHRKTVYTQTCIFSQSTCVKSCIFDSDDAFSSSRTIPNFSTYPHPAPPPLYSFSPSPCEKSRMREDVFKWFSSEWVFLLNQTRGDVSVACKDLKIGDLIVFADPPSFSYITAIPITAELSEENEVLILRRFHGFNEYVHTCSFIVTEISVVHCSSFLFDRFFPNRRLLPPLLISGRIPPAASPNYSTRVSSPRKFSATELTNSYYAGVLVFWRCKMSFPEFSLRGQAIPISAGLLFCKLLQSCGVV